MMRLHEQQMGKVESIINKNPVLAKADKPESGELLLHVIAPYTSTWTLLVYIVLVLNPKALIYRNKMASLPIHIATAHDEFSALEILFSAYKEGINDVDDKGRPPPRHGG